MALKTTLIAELTERVGAEAAQRLGSAVIGVAGLGGLGSLAALTLARSSVGRLILADFDRVEAVNLHRQHYGLADVRRLKTEALADQIKACNPDVTVEVRSVMLDEDNIPEVFRECDVILECFDRAEAKAMILATVADRLPDAYLIGGSGVAGWGRSAAVKTVRLSDRIFICGDLVSASSDYPLYAPRVGLVACRQANLALSIILGDDLDDNL